MIENKQERYDKVNELLNNSISNFDDAWEWKNTTERYETELKGLQSEIDGLKLQVIELRNPPIEISADSAVYVFWGEIFHIENVNAIQFFMQILFSFFMVMMAPAGSVLMRKEIIDNKSIIETLENRERENKEEKLEIKEEYSRTVNNGKVVKSENKQEVVKEAKKDQVKPFNNLSEKGVENIIRVLTNCKDYPLKMNQVQDVHNKFKEIHETNEGIPVYAVEDISKVHRWIYANGLNGKDVQEIIDKAMEVV